MPGDGFQSRRMDKNVEFEYRACKLLQRHARRLIREIREQRKYCAQHKAELEDVMSAAITQVCVST